MVKRITATTAAKRLREVLNEVELNGETFEVERHGKVVAQIRPARGEGSRGMSFGELLQWLRDNPPDPDFARDLKEIRRSVPPIPADYDPWERSQTHQS